NDLISQLTGFSPDVPVIFSLIVVFMLTACNIQAFDQLPPSLRFLIKKLFELLSVANVSDRTKVLNFPDGLGICHRLFNGVTDFSLYCIRRPGLNEYAEPTAGQDIGDARFSNSGDLRIAGHPLLSSDAQDGQSALFHV